MEIQSFPAEAEEEIEKWIEEHSDEFKGKVLLTDGTIDSRLPHEIKSGQKYSEYLDGIFSIISEKALLGEHYKSFLEKDSEEMNMKETEKLFVFLVQQILENEKNIPNEVYVSHKAILDHGSFREAKEKEYEEFKKQVTKFK